MSDKVTVDIAEDVTDISVTEIPTSVTISDPTNTITVEENTTTVNIAPVVTTVTATEQVTTVDISENLTTVGIGDASIVASNLASTIQTTHDSGSWITGANVQTSLDNVATTADSRYVNVTGDTMTGNLLMSYGTTFNFTAPTGGQPVYSALSLANNDIINVNKITFADPGPNEGLQWSNIRIYESPDDLSGNTEGDFQVVYKQSDNSYARRLTVRDTGVDVVGTITFDGGTTSAPLDFPDQVHLRFGDDSDLRIYHDGENSYIDDQGEGSLHIRANDLYLQKYTGANYFSAIDGGATTLFYNGNTTLATTNTGVDVTGTLTFDGGTTSADLNFGDDDKARFGNNQDLQIWHESSTGNSYINESANGNLYISANNLRLTNYGITKSYLQGDADGAVSLYYNGSPKIATTNTGADVTGTVTATTFSGDLNGTINTATTATTQSQANNSTKVATTAYVDTAVAGLVDGAPDGLNTLHELATALEDDVAFSTTVTNNIGTKLAKASNLSDLTNAGTARTNLGLGTAATTNSTAYATSAQGSKADTVYDWGNHADAGYGTSNLTIGSGADQAMAGNTSLTTTLDGLTDVDATTGLANDKILKYNSTDSEWQVADDAGGIALTDISVNGTEGTASGDGGIAYDNTTGVFTYTPPDLAPFQTPETQYVTVNSGPGVVAGNPYVAFGWDATNELPSVQSPDSDGAGQMPIIGFAVETVTNNTVTKLLTFGVIKDHNTNQYSAFGTLASADSTFVDAASDTIYFTNSEAANFVTGDRIQLEVGVHSSDPQGEDFPIALPHITTGEWFVRKMGTLSHNGNFYSGFRFYNELGDCLLGNSNYRTFAPSDVTAIAGETVYLRNIGETKYLFASPAQGKLRRTRPKLTNNEVQQVATILNYGTSTGAILVDIGNPEPTDVLDSGEFRYNPGSGVQKADFPTTLKNISGIGRNGDFFLQFGTYQLSTHTPRSRFSSAIHSDTVEMNPTTAPDPGYSIVFGENHDYKGFNNAVFGQENTITATNAANIFGGYQNETTAAANDRNLVVGLSNTLAGGVVDTVITGDNNILNNTARGVIFGQNNANAYSVGSIVGGKNAVARASHQSVTIGADNFGATTSSAIPNVCMWNGGLHTALFGKSNSAGLATDGSFVCGEQNRVGASSFTHYQLQPGSGGSTKEIPYSGGAMPVEPARRSFITGSHNVLTAASWSAAIGYGNKCASDYSFILGKDNTVGTAGGNHVQGLLGEGLLSPQHSGNVNIGPGQIVVGTFNDKSDFDAKLRGTPSGGWYLNNKHCFSVGTGSSNADRKTSFVVVPRQVDASSSRDFCGVAIPALVGTASYADDNAAGIGGVPVGGLYHTNGTIKIKLT